MALKLNYFTYPLILLILLYFFVGAGLQEAIPKSLLLMNTTFLGIVLEALPFVFLGVFMSALIQTFVSEDAVRRSIPKNAYAAIVPAVLVTAIFPVCECAIIPVVRRLMKKGMPLHVGMIFLAGAPILNPIVFASTYFAFPQAPEIAYARMGIAAVVAALIGLLVYAFFSDRSQLKWSAEELVGQTERADGIGRNSWRTVLFHASDEFFDMGKFLLIGALVASAVQTFFNRSELLALSQNDNLSPLLMMAFGFVLSLCSEADAFVAASFAGTFTTGSLLAFLIYGPILDIKSTIMLFGYFRAKFVIGFMAIVTVIVYTIVLLYQTFFL
ncbi:permease [Sporosarcina trichiuri]|uniref:permease n=1 Tax=Sporosarcina trichiuri TaxID=3056445 RepID=UPI0025B42EA9|nr:permease [Sporosarcina sp. 0.2-SM1T-5]WJY27569.1 permease [Sporosarcina sp. 0.2-SM1T-5]